MQHHTFQYLAGAALATTLIATPGQS